MVGLAGHALAYLAATALLGALAAHAAELMASVPVELGPTLGQNTSFSRTERGCGGPGLFKPPWLIQIQLVERIAELRHVDSKVRNVVLQTEKHRWHSNIEAGNIGRTNPPEPCLLRRLDEYIELPERQETTPSVVGLLIKPLLITAIHITAVQRIPSKHMWIHRVCSSS